MEVLCTSVIPIKLGNATLTGEVLQHCKDNGIITDYGSYEGPVNLKTIQDINTGFLKLFYIPSDKTDIQCAFCETTLTIILTWKNTYDNYYDLVNHSLSKRKKLVKRVLEFNPKDEKLKPLLNTILQYTNHKINTNYAFTFYSIYDENYNHTYEQHIKVLAEPSLINMDDMLSTQDINSVYHSKSQINQDILDNIQNTDISSEQKTYVTWASIVSLSTSQPLYVKNHITLTLMEIIIQRIWNLCYSQNNELNNCITNIKTYSTDINSKIVETYQILIESKNCISATYSSRISKLYEAILKTSQLNQHIQDLEQKLNYLIIFSNSITQTKNRRIQESSEILLFLIAIAQVVPLFFNLPIINYYMISVGSVFAICVLGILIIRFKYRQ